ncbi:MAG: hypothetical protein Q4G42_05190 [Neisseria sp.]|nr:hypothetical protein [Neisseria sp.]
MNNLTQDTLKLVKEAQLSADASLAKGFTQPQSATTGLQGYNLEAPAQRLYPVMTPLRNRIPRVGGGFATQANWKAITGINIGNIRAGVSEGKRGGVVNHSTAERFAAFRGIGLENSVTFEADYAARGFEDVKALAVLQTLQSLMVQEELMILGGNTSHKLGVTPTPTLVATGNGSALEAGDVSVICVALGLTAYLDVAGANNGTVGQFLDLATAQVPGKIARTNADGTSDSFGGGAAQQSAAAKVTVTKGQNIEAKTETVRGAYGYAWFWGAAGQEKLGAITSASALTITAAATGVQAASALPKEDCSTSHLEFDGILTQIALPDSGAYFADQKGAALSSDGAGGVQEFEAAFAEFYNRYRLSPDTIYVNAADLVAVTKLILGSSGAPLLRLNVDINNANSIRAGVKLGSYLNKVTGDELDVVVHPNMPQGTYMFYSQRLPAYVQGVQQLLRILTRQEYYQIEWPLRTRMYEYGVYADEVLQGYFMPAFGMITNAGR